MRHLSSGGEDFSLQENASLRAGAKAGAFLLRKHTRLHSQSVSQSVSQSNSHMQPPDEGGVREESALPVHNEREGAVQYTFRSLRIRAVFDCKSVWLVALDVTGTATSAG